MTSRHRWLGSGLVLAAVATAGFLGLRGGVALREKPQPVGQGGADPSRWASGTRPSTSSRPRIDETPPAAGPVLEGSEGEEAALLVARMGKLVSDLEYSPGLPEPQQQTVAPQPDPWRPDPTREGPPPVIDGVVPSGVRAAGGDRVEIRGRNLRVVQVMFGTVPARLLAASGTLVAVEAPPAAPGPVTIAVTNDDGTWAVAPDPIACGD